MIENMKYQPNEAITPEIVGDLLQNAQLLIPENGVYDKLKSAEENGTQLRVKMGFDPTSPDLHLGHAVAMHQLRKFQDMGHIPVIIIGDFTGRIGDPGGRNSSRPLASAEQISRNSETYIDQLSKVLDISKIEIHRNSEWLEAMNLTDVINLLAQGTLSSVITRDDFRKRLNEGSPIALHEIVYPLLQGADSVAVSADIELGGVDQLYAFQAGRSLQHNKGIDPQALVMMPLLRGLDGSKKMSKSLGNYIGLSDEPNDMFGKVMSIPDTLIEEYLRLASSFSAETIAEMTKRIADGSNPMEVKLLLAGNIVTTYHGILASEQASEHFARQFRNKDGDRAYKVVNVAKNVTSLIDVLMHASIAGSKTQARRLISDGAVKIDGNQISSEEFDKLESIDGLKIKAGKRNFIQVKLNE
jgi:tyrosyl-tRNA synthetase